MLACALSCLLLIALSTSIHYELLGALNSRLPRLRIPARSKLLVVMFVAFVAHALEIALYGAALWGLVQGFDVGSLQGTGLVGGIAGLGSGGASLANCMYFSAETYSSLGFGDLIPVGPIRLLAGVEALNGLLLIGWSASFAYLAMERFWQGGPDVS